jgi:hypothetical protein
MTVELLKLIIRAVILERDADGKITGETVSDPEVIYDLSQLELFVNTMQQQIEQANNGHGPAESD